MIGKVKIPYYDNSGLHKAGELVEVTKANSNLVTIEEVKKAKPVKVEPEPVAEPKKVEKPKKKKKG